MKWYLLGKNDSPAVHDNLFANKESGSMQMCIYNKLTSFDATSLRNGNDILVWSTLSISSGKCIFLSSKSWFVHSIRDLQNVSSGLFYLQQHM